MTGGVRFLCIAAGIAALLSVFGTGFFAGTLNYPEQQRYQSYRYAADKPLEVDPTAAARTDPEALENRSPCDHPKGETESDLCAQWKAANAAENSALWTKWGFWIGVIGSALLLWQIMLTRIAVEDTGEATVAMRKANEIARESMERQLRAYLDFNGVKWRRHPSKDTPGKIAAGLFVCIKNYGQTPATQPLYTSRYLIQIDGQKPTPLGPSGAEPVESIAPSDHFNINSDFELPERVWAALGSGEATFISEIAVTYLDAFGTTQTLKSHFRSEGNGDDEHTVIRHTRKAT